MRRKREILPEGEDHRQTFLSAETRSDVLDWPYVVSKSLDKVEPDFENETLRAELVPSGPKERDVELGRVADELRHTLRLRRTQIVVADDGTQQSLERRVHF